MKMERKSSFWAEVVERVSRGMSSKCKEEPGGQGLW